MGGEGEGGASEGIMLPSQKHGEQCTQQVTVFHVKLSSQPVVAGRLL